MQTNYKACLHGTDHRLHIVFCRGLCPIEAEDGQVSGGELQFSVTTCPVYSTRLHSAIQALHRRQNLVLLMNLFLVLSCKSD